MSVRPKYLAAVLIMSICFISVNLFAQQSADKLKSRLDELRLKKSQLKSAYDDGLNKINRDMEDKLSKLKAEFHKTRDGYLQDKNDKIKKLRDDYDSKISPILSEEKSIVETVGASIGMNFAKPKSERAK